MVNQSINLPPSVSSLCPPTFICMSTHVCMYRHTLHATVFLLDSLLYILLLMSLMNILVQFKSVCGEGKPHIKIFFCDTLNPSCQTPTLLDMDRVFRQVLSTCCVPYTMQGSWDTRMNLVFREFLVWWTDM